MIGLIIIVLFQAMFVSEDMRLFNQYLLVELLELYDLVKGQSWQEVEGVTDLSLV